MICEGEKSGPLYVSVSPSAIGVVDVRGRKTSTGSEDCME